MKTKSKVASSDNPESKQESGQSPVVTAEGGIKPFPACALLAMPLTRTSRVASFKSKQTAAYGSRLGVSSSEALLDKFLLTPLPSVTPVLSRMNSSSQQGCFPNPPRMQKSSRLFSASAFFLTVLLQLDAYLENICRPFQVVLHVPSACLIAQPLRRRRLPPPILLCLAERQTHEGCLMCIHGLARHLYPDFSSPY